MVCISRKVSFQWTLIVVLCVSVLAISSAATLIRCAGEVHPLVISAYRMLISAVMLWLVAPFSSCTYTMKSNWKVVIAAGLFLAIHFGLWIWSLKLTTVANSLVLVTMNPIFVSIGSAWILKEKPSVAALTGTTVSICGCLILLTGGKSASGSDSVATTIGNSMALGGALAMSFYMLAGRSASKKTHFLPYITWVYTIAGILLFSTCLICKLPMTGFRFKTTVFLFLIALIPQVIGHSLINWSLKFLHASYLAAIILLEPFVGSFIAYTFLSETVRVQTLCGGILILLGVAGIFFKNPFATSG
jgi:drug/metabolite transporter (DMT)-like permease